MAAYVSLFLWMITNLLSLMCISYAFSNSSKNYRVWLPVADFVCVCNTCLSLITTSMHAIPGIATEGMGLVDEWTTAYRMSYSNDTTGDYTPLKDRSHELKVHLCDSSSSCRHCLTLLNFLLFWQRF